jgi:tetratricopeptide (TPR) repeat protein
MRGGELESADLLQQGIAAAKSGQKETARRLLMQVVKQNERNVAAWLWLSGVVESLDDKQVALENVLALDPQNQAARKGLDWIRKQKAASVYIPPLISESQARSTAKPLTPAAAILYGPPKEPEPKPEPVPPPPIDLRPRDDWGEPPSPEAVEAMREFDDETLCPYCAAPTQPEDKVCKACHGKLWTYSRRSPEGSYWFWMLLSFLWISAVWRVYLFGGQLFLWFGPLFDEGRIKTLEQFVGIYLGLPTLPTDVANIVLGKLPPLAFWSFVLSVAVQLMLALLIYARWRPIYWIGVGLAVIYLAYTLILTLMSFSWPAVLNLVVALLPVLILVMIQDDFLLKRERLLCGPDPGLRNHSAFYIRGREYARKKMWAQAAVHFRRAAGGAPHMLAYHLALAAAYVNLKRYERAESVLREAQRLEPDNPKVKELSDLVATRKASAATV